MERIKIAYIFILPEFQKLDVFFFGRAFFVLDGLKRGQYVFMLL